MTSLIVLGGALLFFVLLMLSIALHELGHMSFAKLFGVRVPQYMVGFGPTIWSRRRGDTEYGLKAIPLGGYIRMIGMLPPRRQDPAGYLRPSSSGRFSQLIDSARQDALEEVRPGDEDRVFYVKKWWQKLIVMFAGPAMNLLLAVFFFGLAIMGIGIHGPTSTISTVAKCTVPVTDSGSTCSKGEPLTPAAAAGLRAGDKIVSFDGHSIGQYSELQKLIRGDAGRPVELVVQRDGKPVTLHATITSNTMQDLTNPDKTVKAGFLGITPVSDWRQGSIGDVGTQLRTVTTATFSSLKDFPQKMVGVAKAAFGGEKRDPNGPIGVVGASRLGGEVLASNDPVRDKLSFFVTLLAGINFAVGVFNLIPLLPLDGGHMAGALWEGLKKAFARVFGRADPGYVDVAKALPLTYVMAAVFMVMGALLIYADVVNPIRITG